MCSCLCMCVYMSVGAHRGQRHHILQELQALVSGYWEWNFDLQKQYVLLIITELSLHPNISAFTKMFHPLLRLYSYNQWYKQAVWSRS